MDFIDLLRMSATRADKLKPQIQTEEATKHSLIMPFFQQVFGYDVFNPDEFIPEFTADVGLKKGEKVDYAIMINGEPVILIEAKWCGAQLEKHDSQLFRYFGTTKAKIGILTNGIVYKFYTDLEEQNKMDLVPFLELNLLDIKETQVPELKKFCKTNFNADEIMTSASTLKYAKAIRTYFDDQLKEPSEDFAKLIIGHVYDGLRTQNIIEKFKPLIKTTLNNYINELMNDKIKTALNNEQKENTEQQPLETSTDPAKDKAEIVTTDEELEAFGIVKSLICEVLDPAKVSYKDTSNYMNIIYDGRVTKWICRLILSDKRKTLIIPTQEGPDCRIPLGTVNDLYANKQALIDSAKRFA